MSAPPPLDVLGLSANCVEVLRHLWDYLDAEMTPARAERLRAHIASCEECRGYEGYQACFLEALASVKAQGDAPLELREKLAAKLRGAGCGCWDRARSARGPVPREADRDGS